MHAFEDFFLLHKFSFKYIFRKVTGRIHTNRQMGYTMIPEETIIAIQKKFHSLILERASKLVRQANVELPSLKDIAQSAKEKAWFDVPGLINGIAYHLENGPGGKVALIVESWCRVLVGKEQPEERIIKDYTLIDGTEDR